MSSVNQSPPNLLTASCFSIITPSWTRTALATRLVDHPLFRDAVLEPAYVADIIVKQILSKRSGNLILPKKLSRLSGLRGWPSWLQMIVWKHVSVELPGLEHGIA